MIYTQQDEKTFIYPFAGEGLDPVVAANCLIVRPGSVQIDLDRMIVSPEMARTLAEALLHAVEVAEGRRE